jgi:tRNA/rRNA methyltransferase
VSDRTLQNNFKVILLEPKDSLNVGSVARAMMNFGFSELILIRPREIDLDLAGRTARRASTILDNVKICQTEAEALNGVNFVAGFSTKFSKNTPPVKTLPEFGRSVCEKAAGTWALLFGPEDTGLRYDDLFICNLLVRIPSSSEYDSLNLAQAAMLVFYEIAKDHIELDTQPEQGADAANYLALDSIIEELAVKSEFKHSGTPHNTMNLLKNIFRRPVLLEREMQILMGFFSRLNKKI